MHSVVSFQREGNSPRVTVYLAPRLYRGALIGDSERRALFRAWNGELMQGGVA